MLFNVLAIFAWALLGFLLFLVLFEPGLRYEIHPRPVDLESDEFLRLLGALCDTEIHGRSRFEVLSNGEAFYPAQLAAIAAARETINLEAYIFHKGEIASRFVDALAERARAGVRVKVVVDAVGSFFTRKKTFEPLLEAGGRMEWYQPITWYTFKRWNNRTHRKLLVVDGRVAFVGGADIADEWLHDTKSGPRWRDTVFRVEGDLVTGLQSTFAENWLEASSEILADEDYFPRTREKDQPEGAGAVGIVVNSTPSAARGTRAHILFQTLLAYAQRTIHITTPYFTPDQSSLCELVQSAKDRGVKVVVLTPGKRSDHLFTRSSARRRYGDLLKAGAQVHEYQPAMIHTKTMVIDGLWSVVGSTNFDNRSLGLNDEVNVAVRDRALAERIEEDFQRDLAQSEPITYDHWKHRPLSERVIEWLLRVIERLT